MGGSSSHKRRSRKGRYARRGPATPRDCAVAAVLTAPQVLSYDDHAITAGVGFDMLSRAGWVAGTPLGATAASSRALSLPIPVVVRAGRAGIGATPTFATSPIGAHSLAASPASERREERVRIFDPLRPRCRFDPTHDVPSLKALQKHEASCYANPHRSRARRAAPALSVSAPPAPGLSSWMSSIAASDDELSDLGLLSDSDLSDESDL